MLILPNSHAIGSYPFILFPMPTGSLVLITEKQKAHTRINRAHGFDFCSVQFSPDGTKVSSSVASDQTIKIWELVPMKEVEVEMTDDAMIVVTIDSGKLGITDCTENDGACRVRSVNEGSAAQKAGVCVGAFILAVNGESTIGKMQDQVLDMLNSASFPKTIAFSREADLIMTRENRFMRHERCEEDEASAGAFVVGTIKVRDSVGIQVIVAVPP